MDINTQNIATVNAVPEVPRTVVNDSKRVEAMGNGARSGPRYSEDQAAKVAARSEQVEAKKVEVKPEEMMAMAESLNKGMEMLSNTSVRFRLDNQHGNELLISVVDQKTDEIVRQIPSEEMLEMARRMKELQGVLFDQKA